MYKEVHCHKTFGELTGNAHLWALTIAVMTLSKPYFSVKVG